MASTTEQEVGKTATWEIDPQHTLVEFSARHMMFTTVKGRFGGVRGTIVVDEADPTRSRADVEIDAASIDTRASDRDAHLRSADFLDVERYPLITFQSTRVERLDDEHLRMAGDLTIRGTTRGVTLDVAFNGRGVNPWGAEVAGFTAETALDRRDYGLVWNVPLQAGGILVSNTVKILLEVQTVKK